MPYALVTIEKSAPRDTWPDGLDFYVHELPKDEGVQQIAESAWLVRLDTDLLALANLVRLAHDAKLPCHSIFFLQKPDLLSFSWTPPQR
jgi:hypothetical protein